MEILDNINKTVQDDLQTTIRTGSKLSIAAACFSIYAYEELKKELSGIDSFRFIFTSTGLCLQACLLQWPCLPSPLC